ncbi:MAG: hypothetical protein K2X90_00070 [Candidatus Babeliaceae bacterium]|nr:hypothetical protein [Candidatus Babeliaceae bacterium]
MKNLKKILILSAYFIQSLYGSVGCMENSKHAQTKDGYDYKTLHYVECSCPCQKQRHLIRKGKCFKCRHYVKLDAEAFDTSFLYETQASSIFSSMRPSKYF